MDQTLFGVTISAKRVLVAALVTAAVAVGAYLLIGAIQKSSSSSKTSAYRIKRASTVSPTQTSYSSMPTDPYSSQPGAVDMLAGQRVNSMKATGYSADSSVGSYNQNLIGSIQAPKDMWVGTGMTTMQSQPVGSKPIPLGTGEVGSNAPRGTRVDLSQYASMGSDRAMGHHGLDLPADLALASVNVGHMEIAMPTRNQATDPRGEPAGAWQVGYSTNTSGETVLGSGSNHQELNQYVMAQQAIGVPY